mgnify:FL=1
MPTNNINIDQSGKVVKSASPDRDSRTAKQNYTAQTWSNDHGSITLGQVDYVGSVTSAFFVEGKDARHSFSLDNDGTRKGWTTSTSPGAFQVECGSDRVEAEDSLILEAKNGNIVIKAHNGKIRLQGTDIELVAVGEGNAKGNIVCSATETFMIHETKKVLISASAMYKLSTCGIGEVTANSVLKVYGSVIRGVTDACSVKDSKVGGKRYQVDQNKD